MCNLLWQLISSRRYLEPPRRARERECQPVSTVSFPTTGATASQDDGLLEKRPSRPKTKNLCVSADRSRDWRVNSRHILHGTERREQSFPDSFLEEVMKYPSSNLYKTRIWLSSPLNSFPIPLPMPISSSILSISNSLAAPTSELNRKNFFEEICTNDAFPFYLFHDLI